MIKNKEIFQTKKWGVLLKMNENVKKIQKSTSRRHWWLV